MDFIYRLIGTPLGWIMWVCYHFIENYGLALLVFTILVRGAMIPLSLKQQKSSVKMQLIQPKMMELQKKYANNREKLAEEMNKLYKQENYSPTAGCLPMLLPLLIMFGLIDVVYRPLKHILRLSGDMITQIEEIALSMGLVPSINGLNSSQIRAVQSMSEDPSSWLASGIPQDMIDQITNLDLSFLGINLGLTPSTSMITDIFRGEGFNLLLLIPLLSGITALIMSLISLRNASLSAAGNAQMAGSMKIMMLIMPLFSLMIAFSVPAGVGLYWTYSNIFGIFQSLLLFKFYNPREMAEKARREQKEREERERQERIEAKKLAKQKAKEEGVSVEQALSEKEINRRKLAEARKRDAEKYGEEYVEVTDKDLK